MHCTGLNAVYQLRQTMGLGKESAPLYKLNMKQIAEKPLPKLKLKALKMDGIIQIDENSEIHGIPKAAWDYKLGNRSAIEWVLDQFKEKKPNDLTILEKFNSYRFNNYRNSAIELIKRICSVSINTMDILVNMSKRHFSDK